jgi:tetratricopeptide (TPR) repeat protein
MNEPFEPTQTQAVASASSIDASVEAPAPDGRSQGQDSAAAERLSTVAEDALAAEANASSEPALHPPGDTLSTLAGASGLVPEWASSLSRGDASGSSEPEGADAMTFQLLPPEYAKTFPDVTADEPVPGESGQVAGYEILGLLGRGAMGVVYKARQRGLKRIVALKMISAGGHCRPAELARFQSEAVAVAEVQHPNIVQIYEVGEDRGHPYFSLEHVEGGSLSKKIGGTPQPPRESAQLVQSLADGMQYAHERGIIHRDLKPANVLLTLRGEPKVTDFGLVKRLEDDSGQTQSGSILGTPSYMAPEQAEGKIKQIGPRSDIYALGGILYELLTGRAPFRAASVLDTLQQVRTKEPIPPSQFQPKLPRDLETICLKCLQKESAKRYATAAALGEDLRRFLAGEPILARRVSRAEWLWRWCWRNQRVAALAAAVAILVAGWAVTSTLLFRLALANEREAIANAATASRSSLLAEHNAAEAQSKAEEALASAETARRNSELATANEARARGQETAAKAIAQEAIVQMIHLGEQVMRRLRTKHDPAQAEAEWLRLRDDLLTMLRRELVPLAERIEGKGVTPFAFATLHQRLGDLFRKLGQVDDARREYLQGCDRLTRTVQEQPRNDMARANLGVMLMRLGEVALDQGGDAAQARDEFARDWTIQDQIAQHPRSGAYSQADNLRILSGIALKQGIAELALGHPARARDYFQRALDLRYQWTQVEPDNVSAQSYRSEAEVRLGAAYSHQGDWPNARRHIEEAVQICVVLVDRFPGDSSFKGDLASVHYELGMALWRVGRIDEADKALQHSLKYARIALARYPDDLTQRQTTASASECLAAIAQKRGKPADAVGFYHTAFQIRTDLAQAEPQNLPAQAALALALAHMGRYGEAIKIADQLKQANGDRPAILIAIARIFAACARSEAHRHRAIALANGTLAVAIGHDYRDTPEIRTDPDFAELFGDPRFQCLVDGIKP